MIIRDNNGIIIVKLFMNSIYNIDIYDINDIYDFFRDLFKKIKDNFNISGYCCVDVFINENYGMIIEINNVYKYGEDVKIKLSFHTDCIFLMEVNDMDYKLFSNIYFYDNKYYAFYDDNYDSSVIYKNCNDIIKKSVRINC